MTTLADLLKPARLSEVGTVFDSTQIRRFEARRPEHVSFQTQGRRRLPEETVAADGLRRCGDPDTSIVIENENMVTAGSCEVRPTGPGVDQTAVRRRSLSPIGPPSWQRQEQG